MNSSLFSGRMVKQKENTILLENKVGKKIKSTFKVFLPPSYGEMPKFNEGQEVLVREAISYNKEGELIFRISSPDKVAPVTISGGDINVHSFTGEVNTFNPVTENPISGVYEIKQVVKGIMPTTYYVFIPSYVWKGNERLLPACGDYVAVTNTICYEKEGQLRFKVESIDQLQVLKPDGAMKRGEITI